MRLPPRSFATHSSCKQEQWQWKSEFRVVLGKLNLFSVKSQQATGYLLTKLVFLVLKISIDMILYFNNPKTIFVWMFIVLFLVFHYSFLNERSKPHCLLKQIRMQEKYITYFIVLVISLYFNGLLFLKVAKSFETCLLYYHARHSEFVSSQCAFHKSILHTYLSISFLLYP